MSKVAYVVYRTRGSNTFGVYRQPARDGSGQEMVEGGFFNRAAAEASRDEWQAESDKYAKEV